MSEYSDRPQKSLPDDLEELRFLRKEVIKAIAWVAARYQWSQQKAKLELHAQTDREAAARYQIFLNDHLQNGIPPGPRLRQLTSYLSCEARATIERYYTTYASQLMHSNPQHFADTIAINPPPFDLQLGSDVQACDQPGDRTEATATPPQDAPSKVKREPLRLATKVCLQALLKSLNELLDRINDKIDPMLASGMQAQEGGQGQARAPVAPATTPAAQNMFRIEGNDWTARFEDKPFLLGRHVGFFYIASLLEHPNQEFSAMELRQAYNRFRKARGEIKSFYKESEDPLLEECLGSGVEDLGEVIDRIGYGNIRHKIEELGQDIDRATRSGDAAEVGRLKQQMQMLADLAHKSYQPDGKPRKLKKCTKADRDQVRNAIQRALDKIREKSPALYRHLNNSLTRGSICSYTPEKPTRWNQ